MTLCGICQKKEGSELVQLTSKGDWREDALLFAIRVCPDCRLIISDEMRQRITAYSHIFKILKEYNEEGKDIFDWDAVKNNK